MNYAEIKKIDVANGPGVRVSLFVSGCPHHCKNCFNEELWDYNYGHPFTESVEEEILNLLNKDYISGLTLLGGEPMVPSNMKELTPFVKRVKEQYPNKTIWCYTGYLFDKEVLDILYPKYEFVSTFLKYIDVVVDGRFIESLAHKGLQFRGSKNQRVIDVQKSLKEGKMIELPTKDKEFQKM